MAYKFNNFKNSKITVIITALVFFSISIAVAIIIHHSQKAFLNRALNVSSKNLETTIFNKTQTIVKSIERMAARWEFDSGSGFSEDFWRADARNYIENIAGIVSMMWIDDSGIIQWVESIDPKLAPDEGIDLMQNLQIMGPVPLPKINRKPEFSTVTPLTKNSYAIHVLFPTWKNSQFEGYIGVRFDTQILISDMIDSGERSGFVTEAFADGFQVYKGSGDFDRNGPSVSFSTNMDDDEDGWNFRVFPVLEVLTLFKTPLPIIVAVAGSLIALLLLMTMNSRLRAKNNNVLLAKEIKKRKQIESKLDYMTQHDALTHLPNRNYLKIYLDNKIKESHMSQQKIAVMFLNIDDFKQINDTYSHDLADELLKHIPNKINEVMNENAMIAHLGGDEFVICIADNLIDQKLFVYAEDLLKNFRIPITIDNTILRLTASIGVSYYPEHGNKVNILMTKAEHAMNQSKVLGKDTYNVFDESVETSAVLKTAMINSFNQALDDHEFEMYFQPRHNIKTGEMVSAEALLRWKTDGKVLTPDKFLEAAEESGMIVSICNSAFNVAFAQYQQLFEGELPIMLSINVSAKQLGHADFLNDLFAMLDHHHFPCDKLEVELTEQTLIENYDSSLATLNALSSAGVKIALDDFGTGYSSLSYLKNFPVDVLKIDKSFVNDIHNDAGDLELTKAIIAMGQSLNMEVVAEGIENKQQYKILADLGCHQAQGYFLSKPLNYNDFCELFEYQMHKFDAAVL